MADISIVICSLNRADELEATLTAFQRVKIPAGYRCEIVIIDNGSVDDTIDRAKCVELGGFEIRILSEPMRGKGNALNTAVANISSEIILLTDDDVRPAENWIEALAGPLLGDECDAVVGRTELAPHLARTWLTQNDRIWLACPELSTADLKFELVGANMGFHRRVLDRVPKFDPELGPGASGFGEDSLFTYQLRQAGFRLKLLPEATVTHNFNVGRLQRRGWLADARKRGRTRAYLAHHWFHQKIDNALMRYFYLALKLYSRRMIQPPQSLSEEGYAPWEISYVYNLEMCKTYLKERRRPRHYSRRGLVKNGRVVTGAKERLIKA